MTPPFLDVSSAADVGCARPAYQASAEGGVGVGSLGDLSQARELRGVSDVKSPSSVGPYVRIGFQHPLLHRGFFCLRGEGFASFLSYSGGTFPSPRNSIVVVTDGVMALDVGWMVRQDTSITSWLSLAPGVGLGMGLWRYTSEIVQTSSGTADGALPSIDLRLDVPLRFHVAERHTIFVAPGLVYLLPVIAGDNGGASPGHIGQYDIRDAPRTAYGMDGGRASFTLSGGYALSF